MSTGVRIAGDLGMLAASLEEGRDTPFHPGLRLQKEKRPKRHLKGCDDRGSTTSPR